MAAAAAQELCLFLALTARGLEAFASVLNKKTFVSVILAFGSRVVGCLACCGFFLSNKW